MRLGGPTFLSYKSPEEWVSAVHVKGFRAAYCPVDSKADDATVKAYADAAKNADIVIAETGAWSNPMSDDAATAREAFKKCVDNLALAERIGARCCVNITGSRGSVWDGPHPLNLTAETFAKIVDVTRKIIDAVKPTRTFYSLETMPWMFPDTTESYEKLIVAIDRKGFGVHMDPVNMVCSPRVYFDTPGLIRDFCRKLGPKIQSCHAKDILLSDKLTTHLDEVVAGRGNLCYRTFLKELSALDANMPLMLEHLGTEKEYDQAATHIRSVASKEGVRL